MAQAEAVEIVNFQVTAVGTIPKPQSKRFETRKTALPAAPHENRIAYFDGSDATEVPVYRRSALAPGATIEGPAVIEEKTSTTVLYPGQRARVDEYLNIEVAASMGNPRTCHAPRRRSIR